GSMQQTKRGQRSPLDSEPLSTPGARPPRPRSGRRPPAARPRDRTSPRKSRKSAAVLRILVLAHDLADDSVHKRVAMLDAGGAAVTVAGFRRTPEPVGEVAGHTAVDLGRTRDAAFAQRVWAVVRAVLRRQRYRELFESADVIVARNLEMLAVAVAGQRTC